MSTATKVKRCLLVAPQGSHAIRLLQDSELELAHVECCTHLIPDRLRTIPEPSLVTIVSDGGTILIADALQKIRGHYRKIPELIIYAPGSSSAELRRYVQESQKRTRFVRCWDEFRSTLCEWHYL